MKIKTYKGPSLEKLYKTIHSELGPEAVVVCPYKPKGLGKFFKRDHYELIAVLDDDSASENVISKYVKPLDIQKLSNLQSEKWEMLKGWIDEMREEMKTVRSGIKMPLWGRENDVPRFALNWDARFVEMLRSEFPGSLKADNPYLVKDELAEVVSVKEDFSVKRRRKNPQIVALAGPTGSGKTTTLAKLAAKWSIDDKLNVGVVTTDTYRVAAVDQIKEYSTLLGLDLKVVFSASEASRAVASFSDKDVILVDTPGKNHHDQISMCGLRGILESMGAVTTILLVPATLDKGNVSEVVSSFGALSPSYMAVTKVDESNDFSVFTTITCETNCPLVFVTDGQRVPQDIRFIRTGDVVDMLLKQADREFVSEIPELAIA